MMSWLTQFPPFVRSEQTEQKATIKGVRDQAPAAGGLGPIWVSARGWGGGGGQGQPGAAPHVVCAVCATCRTEQADAAEWGNRWQCAAAPVRGRWVGGGEGSPRDRLAAVDPLPQLFWASVLGFVGGRRTDGTLHLYRPGQWLCPHRGAPVGTWPGQPSLLQAPLAPRRQ